MYLHSHHGRLQQCFQTLAVDLEERDILDIQRVEQSHNVF